jgi:hypothetical protein
MSKPDTAARAKAVLDANAAKAKTFIVRALRWSLGTDIVERAAERSTMKG